MGVSSMFYDDRGKTYGQDARATQNSSHTTPQHCDLYQYIVGIIVLRFICRPPFSMLSHPSTMLLASRPFGTSGNPPLIILHGLLGSSRNWAGAGKLLASKWDATALDLRNHGDSPHAADASYISMATDVVEWLNAHQLPSVTLLGHSLGGKVAMRVACSHPARVAALIIEDIAPRDYSSRWVNEFAAMRSIDLDTLSSRQEAEDALATTVPDWGFRKFLISNLTRDPLSGKFRWQCNLDVLAAALPELFKTSLEPGDHYAGPALVLRGSDSNYMRDTDTPRLLHHFPNMQLKTIDRSGHNLHTEQPAAFVSAITTWATERAIS
ncbi:MAG: alpha/beta fold hydrolase [Verrucomicrobiota bacterium]|nr:alpha/beta fold hydrolase [Verrucomicrobiota bacterium]